MNKTIATFLASVILLSLGFFNIGHAAELKPARDYFQIFSLENNKPSVLFVDGSKCKDCLAIKDILERLADKRSDYDFYIDSDRKTDEGYIYVRFPRLDFVTVITLKPGMLDTIEKMSALLDERFAYYKRVVPVKRRLEALQNALSEMRVPFDAKQMNLRKQNLSEKERARSSAEIEAEWDIASAGITKRLSQLSAQYDILLLRK
jgi:hypothetical protein